MINLKKYWMVWKTSSLLSIQTSMENRLSVVFFSAGKLIRFVLFIGFILLLGKQFPNINGFTTDQLILFFLVFNLFDLFGQLFFRGIYFFRHQVVSGEFDFRLTKPISPLFQALTRHTDILDLPLLIIVIVMLLNYDFSLTIIQLFIVLILFIVALMLITAIHIIVASLGVITTEVDHTIMIYRDFSNMARFPIDIYHQLIRGFLTFVIPIAIAYSLPAKGLIGSVSLSTTLLATVISITFLFLSLKFWRYALTKYSSASS